MCIRDSTKDLYLHIYKKEHGFFVKDEIGRRFQEATILALSLIHI